VPDVAVDNDVLIKAACYGLAAELEGSRSLGVLGAAKYVVAGRIDRMALSGDRDGARSAALDLIARSSVLEPSRDELDLATAIETAAQRRGLELDAGESQLAAMIVHRGIAVLETGDKRAIKGFEVLLDELSDLGALRGRLRCLEQIVAHCLDAVGSDALARAICGEPHVDKTLSICFRCFSPPPHAAAPDRDGLDSYIAALRASAQRVLEP
jgi:predicted nucleic acid-binding protein